MPHLPCLVAHVCLPTSHRHALLPRSSDGKYVGDHEPLAAELLACPLEEKKSTIVFVELVTADGQMQRVSSSNSNRTLRSDPRGAAWRMGGWGGGWLVAHPIRTSRQHPRYLSPSA
jgi:hypothetical protein